MNLRVDQSIIEAIDLWMKYGLDPGSCTRLLLEGNYPEALKHAHPLIKPYWTDHILYIERLPEECKGEHMKTWKEKSDRHEYYRKVSPERDIRILSI